MGQNKISDEPNNVIELKTDNFIKLEKNARSDVARISKMLTREVRKAHLSYSQLKRIFILTREAASIEVPKSKGFTVTRIPTSREVTLFLEAMNKNLIHRLMFETLLGTGLRVAELCDLEVAHIDFDANLIWVENGKGGKRRPTVMGNKLKAKIELYLAGKKQRFLFETVRAYKFTTRRVQALAEHYSKEAGVDVRCHDCRRIWNTRLAEQNLSESQRALWAGHSKSSATQLQARYTFLSAGSGIVKANAIKALDEYE